MTEYSHGNRWVVNLSSKQLEGPHLSALSKGLNFAPAPACIPTAHIIANVEAAMGRANADESMNAKACMNIIGDIHRAKMPPKNVTPKEMQALKDLAKDEEILVLPADKGKATVVMNKADYDHKMQQVLCDEDTHQPLKKDPMTSLENKMNARLLQLKKCGRLPPDVYSQLRSSAGRVPMLNGLPKVHKPDVPL